MKQQSCLRTFLRYTILSVLGTLGVSCYILADTFFISKGLGAAGLTALNLAIPVYNFIHGTGLMLGMGGATQFSIDVSRGQIKRGSQIYTHTIYLAVLSSILFAVIGLFGSEQLAAVLGADESVKAMTATYLRWLLLFSPMFILNAVLLCFVRNDGSPQLSMIAMLAGSLMNIILDYIFIFPLQMGIFGAVLATGFSPFISMLMMLPHWRSKKNTFHLIKSQVALSLIKPVISLGFPSLIAQIASGVVMILFNVIILELTGNIGVAAYGVVANLALVVLAIYTGMAQGMQPLISRFYGQKNQKQVQTVYRYALILMLLVSMNLYGITFIFASPIAAIFNSEKNTVLQQIAVAGLQLYFISNFFVGYNTILATFFTSTEKALPAQVLSLLRGLFLIIPLALLLSSVWGMTGVWLTYPVTEGLTALLGFAIYMSRKRRK